MRWLTSLAVSGWLLTACEDSGNGTPGGPRPDDAGITERDSGTPAPEDAGPSDAGLEDAGSTDAGPTDFTPPDAPELLGSSPASPANDNLPRILARTEPGARVRLYTVAGCSGAIAGEGTANSEGQVSVPVTVADDSWTSFYGLAVDAAGNASPCSSQGVTYREDSTPPATPTLATTPASPANHTTPVLQVTTEPGAEVRFFAGTTCVGTELATRTADNQGQVSLSLSVSDNSTSAYVARALDSVGNVSACSATLTYVEDSTAPSELAATVMDGLSGPDIEYQNRATRVTARWSGFSDSVGIHHYELAVTSTTACPGNTSSPQDVGNAPSADITVGPLAEQRHYTCVRAVDGAGNISGWRRSDGFIVDVTPPRVMSTYPAPNWPSVSPWDDFEVMFNEATLDTTSVTPAAFRVLVDGREVSTGPVSCAASTCTLSLPQWLPYGAQVGLTLSGVRDLAGNVMTDSFTASYGVREPHWGSARLMSSGNRARSPSLTMNASGEATIMYGDNGLRARRRRPNESWSAAQLVGEGILGIPGPTPVLTTLSNGNPLAVVASGHVDSPSYRVYGILGTNSGDGTQTWSVPQELGANTGLQAVDPRLVATPDGRALALWTENGSAETSLWVQSFSSDSGWEAPEVVRTIPIRNWTASWDGYDLAVDAQGHGVLAWSEANSPLQYSRQQPWMEWSAPMQGEGMAGTQPRMAMSAEGTGVAVWARRFMDNGEEVVRLYANTFSVREGFSDQEVPLHTRGYASSTSARVGMDPNGNAFVIWRQDNFALYAARYVKGSGWQAPERLEEDMRGGNANLSVFPSGKALVVYGRNEGSYAPTCVRQFAPGTGWSTRLCFSSTSLGGHPQDFQVVTSPLGNAIATWIYVDSDGVTTTLAAATLE